MSFSDFEYAGKRKPTCRERFLTEMDQVVPWSGLLALIEPYYPKAGGGRKPYPCEPGALARCIEWLNWLSGTVHSLAYGQIWRPQRVIDDPACFPDVVAKGMKNVELDYAFIEHQLKAMPDTETYTIVHPVLLVFWLWGKWINLDMSREYPVWAHTMRLVVERPAVRRALATEGIDSDLFA